MLRDFRAFVLRGNVVDLAVGVLVGAAFGRVVASFVENLLTPLAAIPGETDFSALDFTIRNSTFHYGVFLNDVIAFVIVAATVFFFVVRPLSRLMERRRTERDVEAVTRACPECLSDIPTGARRCAFCTAEVAPAA